MKDFKKRLSNVVICKSDFELEILNRIADESKQWELILNEFSGKVCLANYIGILELKKPHRMKFLVLDWFRFLLVDKGINLKDVTSGAFLLSINKNTIDKTYDREETEKGQRRTFSGRSERDEGDAKVP